MQTVNRRRERESGLTLPEVVVALAVSTMIMIALQSTVTVAVKSVPDQSGPVQRDVAVARILRQIESELENCTRVISYTSQRVTFLVADRNSDGVDERISYEFSAAGSTLARTYNAEAPVNVLTSISDFSLGFDQANYVFNCSGPITALPAELLAQATVSSGLELLANVNTGASVGEYLVPATSSEKVWKPTLIRTRVRKSNSSSGVDLSLLPAIADGTPASTRHVSDVTSISAASLPTNYSDALVSINTPNAPWIGSGKPLALMISRSDSAGSGSFAKYGSGNNYLYTFLGSWYRSNSSSLEYLLYGQRGNASASYSLNFPIFNAVRVQCQSAPTRTPIYGGCNVLNGVGNIGVDFKQNFNTSPLLTDDNVDGSVDWQLNAGTISASDTNNGRWTANSSSISLIQSTDINQIGIFDVKWKCSTTSTSEGFVSLNCFRTGSNAYPLKMVLRKELDNYQYLTLIDTSSNPVKQIYIATGLSQDDINTRLVFDPNQRSVILLINDVEQGNFSLSSASVSQTNPALILGSSSGEVQFDYARLRVWNP